MDLVNHLYLATLTAQQEDDLPDFLAARIHALAERLPEDHNLHDEISELIEQLSLYDTYGQTGYIGMGVNSLILEGTIRRIEDKLPQDTNNCKERP